MELLDLPLPALQCIIEHMVRAAGPHKAPRLRLVCRLFEDEVKRAIFGTRIFDFTITQPRQYTRDFHAQRLKGKIIRPHLFEKETITSVIRECADFLIEDSGTADVDENRRRQYLLDLCDAAAYKDFAYNSSLGDANEPREIQMRLEFISAAAATANLDKLRPLLSSEFANAPSQTFPPPLIIAARNGHENVVKALLEYHGKEMEPTARSISISNAFMSASATGQTHILPLLKSFLTEDQFLESRIYDRALVAAAGNGQLQTVRQLLLEGKYRDYQDAVSRGLQEASEYGAIDVVQLLHQSGADINWPNSVNGTALHVAARRGNANLVRFLFEQGATLTESRGGVGLLLAARKGHRGVVQILLDHGANINESDNRYSALSAAAKNGDYSMVQFLLNKGIDIQARHVGPSALEFAAEWGREDIVRLLVERGVPINGRKGGNSPMLLALMYEQAHVVKTLLKLGAEEVDPLKSDLAYLFLEGEYPRKRDSDLEY